MNSPPVGCGLKRANFPNRNPASPSAIPGPWSMTATRTDGPCDRALRRTDESFGENPTALESSADGAREHRRLGIGAEAAGIAHHGNALLRCRRFRHGGDFGEQLLELDGHEDHPSVFGRVRIQQLRNGALHVGAGSRDLAQLRIVALASIRNGAEQCPDAGKRALQVWATVATISLRSSSSPLTRARASVRWSF